MGSGFRDFARCHGCPEPGTLEQEFQRVISSSAQNRLTLRTAGFTDRHVLKWDLQRLGLRLRDDSRDVLELQCNKTHAVADSVLGLAAVHPPYGRKPQRDLPPNDPRLAALAGRSPGVCSGSGSRCFEVCGVSRRGTRWCLLKFWFEVFRLRIGVVFVGSCHLSIHARSMLKDRGLLTRALAHSFVFLLSV